MRKRWIAILLGVAMSLSVVACGGEKNANSEPETKVEQNVAPAGEEQKIPETENAEDETPQVQDENTANETEFDSRLAGEWWFVSNSFDGDADVYFSSSFLVFLMNGEFVGMDVTEYEEYFDADVAPMKAYTKGNELCMWDSYAETMIAMGKATQEEADKFTDMKVTYLLEDVSDSLIPAFEEQKPFFEKYDNDKLTIHITGSYRANPTSIKSIDTTYVYQKYYPNYTNSYFLEPSLNGEWDDNMGNQWSFYYEKDENGKYSFKFKMTDSEGTEHIGDYCYAVAEASETDPYREIMKFRFEDFSTDTYTILSYDGKTFNFDNNGTSFVLTRK